jgi:hypothetical protein
MREVYELISGCNQLDHFPHSFHNSNAVIMYMIEDLWYSWKAYLVPQEIPVPQFHNRWSKMNQEETK